jgi:hypothetical protein
MKDDTATFLKDESQAGDLVSMTGSASLPWVVDSVMGYSIDDGFMLEKNALALLGEIYPGGNSLKSIQAMTRDIRQQVENPTTPWLKNSINVRHAFIFKEGMRFSGDTSELIAIRKSPRSKDFLKQSWTERFRYSYDTSGNVFLVKNLRDNSVYNLPLEDIDEIYVDKQNHAYITHVKVEPRNTYWRLGLSSNIPPGEKPYILACYDNDIPDAQFYADHGSDVRIDHSRVFYDIHAARQLGEPLAPPPLLLSTFYCIVAARDFADTSRWRHANSLIAVKVATPTKQSAKKGADRIASIEKSGSVAGYTNDMSITGMGANALNVANNSAMPYLAAAAASVNIPVGQYTMTTQGLGGIAGSLVTLDTPTKAYYKGQQSLIADFFKSILGDSVEIGFVSHSEDSDAKVSAALFNALTNRLLHPDELRQNMEDRYGLELSHASAPTADEWAEYYPQASEPASSSGGMRTADTRDSGHDNEPDAQSGGEV